MIRHMEQSILTPPSDHVIALARLGTSWPVVREIIQIKLYYFFIKLRMCKRSIKTCIFHVLEGPF